MNTTPPTVSSVRTRLIAFVLIALTVAGCSADAGSETTNGSGASSTTLSSGATTSTEGPSTTTIGPQTTVTISDRPLAPEFTLELGGGGEYTLSEGEKPVYLVFWAEW